MRWPEKSVLSSVGQASPFDGFSLGGKARFLPCPRRGSVVALGMRDRRERRADPNRLAFVSGCRREGGVWAEPTVFPSLQLCRRRGWSVVESAGASVPVSEGGISAGSG